MKCGNCSIEISKEFRVAISKNTCPACGKQILATGNLAAFVPLCDLLSNFAILAGVTPEDVESIATLIITNFNVSAKPVPGSPQEKSATVEVVEDPNEPTVVVDENGIKYEKIDKKKAQDLMQKMRDDALSGALEDRGIELSDGNVLLSEDPVSNAELIKQRQKQLDAQDAIQNGAGGKFRRSQ